MEHLDYEIIEEPLKNRKGEYQLANYKHPVVKKLIPFMKCKICNFLSLSEANALSCVVCNKASYHKACYDANTNSSLLCVCQKD
jgi:hypothetical protein